MNYHDHIDCRADTCGGQPVVRGTRVTLKTVLCSLAEGDTVDIIVDAFPTLTRADVLAIIAFAANAARDDLPLASDPTR